MKLTKLFLIFTTILTLISLASSPVAARARGKSSSQSRSYSRPKFLDPMMNPKNNPLVNPQVNPMANPQINPMANPQINPWVNPVVNPAGPLLNPPPWRLPR